MASTTSASQVEAYRLCPRKWYNRSVLKISDPSTPAQLRGTAVHAVTEQYLQTGTIAAAVDVQGDMKEAVEIVTACHHVLPQPGSELRVEQEFSLSTYVGGPLWRGFIDLVDPRVSPLRLIDHKSISDFRYCKTPEELLASTQMMSYARWAFETYPREQVIEVEHLYQRTKKPYKPHRVSAVATRERSEEVWQRDLVFVKEMEAWRTERPETAQALPPNTQACSMYGGCSYKSRCGFAPQISFNGGKLKMGLESTTNGTGLSLSERLAAKRAAQAGLPLPASPVAAPPPSPVAAAPLPPVVAAAAPPPVVTSGARPMLTGDAAVERAKELGIDIPPGAGFAQIGAGSTILPPDAPSRDEKVTISDVQKAEPAVVAEPKKRGRPKKVVEAVGAPTVQVVQEGLRHDLPAFSFPDSDAVQEASGAVFYIGEPSPSAASTAPPTPAEVKAIATRLLAKKPPHGLTIYVDCIPTKGEKPYTLFEDWFRPLAEVCAEVHGLADYRMMDFGKWKGPIALLVKESVDQVPPVLLVSSFSPGAHEAIDVLTPYADRIVRAIR